MDHDSIDYTYENMIRTSVTNDITSDFGARYNRYDWHAGVDFSWGARDNERGDLLYNINDGNLFLSLGQQYKYAIVESTNANNFGYGHLFEASVDFPVVSGECAIVEKNDGTGQLALIVPEFDATGNVDGYIGYGNTPGFATFGGDSSIVVRTTIGAGDIIGPIGDSGGIDFDVHLHLYSLLDGVTNPFLGASRTKGSPSALDPLEFLNHPTTNYDLTLTSEGEPEGTIASYLKKIKVRTRMSDANRGSRYPNHVMHIAAVDVLYGKYESCDTSIALNINNHFEGRQYKSYINLGATTSNSTKYPDPIRCDGNRGSWNTQSICPVAYSADTTVCPDAIAGDPYDDYYFPDIIPRIHATDKTRNAPCPTLAKYEDGQYSIKAVAEDVNGNLHESEAFNVAIDNFPPYIESVTLAFGEHIIYHMIWLCNDQCEGAGGLQPLGGLNPNARSNNVLNDWLASGQEITVNITTSESVEAVGISLNGVSANTVNSSSSENKSFWAKWNGSLSDGQVELVFEGIDCSGNQLLNLNIFIMQKILPLETYVLGFQ